MASTARTTGSLGDKGAGQRGKLARVGTDLAKKVFHLTAVDDTGAVVEHKRVRRAELQSYVSASAVVVARRFAAYASRSERR